MTFISRDEARERVGRLFYGDAWIDKVPDREWQLIERYGPEPRPGRPNWDKMARPCPPGLVKEIVSALGLHQLACAQIGTADEWLQLYGFDCSQPEFFREHFDAALAGSMGKAIAQLRDSLSPAEAIVTDLSGHMTTTQLQQKYRTHAEAVHQQTGRWPSIEADDKWAETNKLTRDRGRALRRKFREGPEFDEARKGGRPSDELE